MKEMHHAVAMIAQVTEAANLVSCQTILQDVAQSLVGIVEIDRVKIAGLKFRQIALLWLCQYQRPVLTK